MVGPERGVDADPDADGHFPASLLYAAAQMYYEEQETQAIVAARLGTSRATVSRLLSEARRRGIVRIEVVPPTAAGHEGLAERLARMLGLRRVYLSGSLPSGRRDGDGSYGRVLAPAVGQALTAAGLQPGDVLLVSSGRTMHEIARFDLPRLPGVVVAPTVGGTDQPEGWFQTNEITRMVADRIGGRATYLFAPAMPGPELHDTLLTDPSIQRVLHLWPHARCVLLGVGAPPLLRSELPQFVPTSAASLREAVGDVCSRFYDRSGAEVGYPGSERLIAVELADLVKLPMVVAVAAGPEKVAPLRAGAGAGYFNELVTDPATAELLVAGSEQETP